MTELTDLTDLLEREVEAKYFLSRKYARKIKSSLRVPRVPGKRGVPQSPSMRGGQSERSERSEMGAQPKAETAKRFGVSQRHFFTLTARLDAAFLIGCGDLSRFEEGKLLSEVMDAGAFRSLPIRRLTLLEWERLQGFPDGWTSDVDLSDAQRYRCLGNAVTMGVVRTVINGIHEFYGFHELCNSTGTGTREGAL